MRGKKVTVKKILRSLAVFWLIAIFVFSNFVSFLPQGLQNNRLADSLKVKNAQAAIDFVGGASASGTNTAYNMSLTSLAGGIGSAPATGDIVIVVNVINNVADGNPGVGTAGYTEPVDIFNIADTNDTNLSVSYKIMGASPDTTVSCNPSSGTTIASNCVAMVFRGIDTTTPLDVTTTTATGQNAEDVNCPAITPVTSGAIVVCAGGGGGASVDQAIPTAPAGYSGSTYKQTDPGSAGGAVASYKLWSGSGAEDPAAYVMDLGTASANSWNGATLALRPLNNPPTLTVTQPDGTGDTVTVGDLYNITYDLADSDDVVTAAMYYDVDATGLNGTAITGACATAAEGTGATCSWDTTGMTPGTYYVYGLTSDGVNPQVSDYSPGVITINAPAGPDATSYANGTETALDFANCGTTGCGARVTTGTNQTITISGTTFGTVAGGSRASCAGGAGTGCVRIANYTVPDANVIAWTDTSIQLRVPAAVSVYGGSGTTCNGADGNGLCVYAAGVADSGGALQFWVFPDITSTSPTPSTGAKEGDAVTISGTRFGAAGGTLVFQNCAGGDVDATPTGANWTDTSLAVTVPSGINDNDDACDIKITRAAGTGSKTDISNNTADNLGTFVILPKVTNYAAISTNAAREYAAGDTDGVIQVDGNHFGTAQGANGKVEFTGGFGTISATIHGTAEGSCTAAGWAAAATSICVEVPASISNSVYSGTIKVTRNDLTAHESVTTFSILPRITGNSPTSGSAGDVIQILGNHFCTTGTCPTSPNRSSGSDNILFGATQAADGDFVDQSGGAGACNGAGAAWTHTEICVKVPTGTPTGSQPTKVTSNTKLSNTSAFTVTSNTPSDPTALGQFKDSGFTLAISVGAYASSTPIYLKQTMEAPGISGGTLYPQFEYQLTGTAFLCGAGACGSAVEGTGSGGPGPTTGSKSITPADGNYHWQARTRHNKGGSDYYSGWVSYGGNNDPNDADFIIDATAPTITSGPSATPGTNSATINWGTNVGQDSTSQVQYQQTAATCATYGFASSCATNNDCTTINETLVQNHNVNLVNLLSGSIPYCFRVRSKDAVGNEVISSNIQFSTLGVNDGPGKTIYIPIMATTTPITTATTTYFTILVPETSPLVKSTFLELTGVIIGGSQVGLQVNSGSQIDYSISATNPTPFKFFYKVLDSGTTRTESILNFNDEAPCTNGSGGSLLCNKIIITPIGGASIAVTSMQFIMNYGYTP